MNHPRPLEESSALRYKKGVTDVVSGLDVVPQCTVNLLGGLSNG